jgi:hypothetical protein
LPLTPRTYEQAFFFLPDTLNRSGPKKSANPIQVFKLFFHPPITTIAFINASTFSIMFLIMFIFPVRYPTSCVCVCAVRACVRVRADAVGLRPSNVGTQIQLEKIYGLSEIGIGLSYLPMGIGNCLGTVAGGRAADHGFAKKVRALRSCKKIIRNVSNQCVVVVG